jgi:chemotaxis protein histidine kinase CheA
MNNNLKITCPKCKATFDAGDAFNAHFENTQIENEKKLKDATKKAEQEAENKFKLQFEKQQEEIEKIKKAESKKANEEAEKKYKSQLENKDKQLAEAQKNLEQKLKEEAEKKLELAKKEALKKAEEIAEKKFQAVIDKQKEELEKSKKSEEILKKRVDERTQEISQIMQNRKVELQGEIQEERLQDFLRRKFPEDTIEEIKKGAKGGDCILSINYKNKKAIAKIYFESKDTKNFNEAWVDKLLSDMKDKGIANGIIVVSKSALPTDFDETSSFVQRHSNSIKIIPMELDIIHAVVDGIRSILILKSRENNDHEIPDLMKKCWINLNSPNFILPIKTMVAQIRIMENLFKKEKDSFERTSAIKDRTIKEIQANLVAMVTSFNRYVGDIFPQDLLEHKDDKYLE